MADATGAGGKEEGDLEEKVGASSGDGGGGGDSELLVWADLDAAATGELLSEAARADVDTQYRWDARRAWGGVGVCHLVAHGSRESGHACALVLALVVLTPPRACSLALALAVSGRQLASMMGLEDYETNPRRHILLDFHFYNLQFAQEVGFSDAQTSAFFSIMKATIDHASAASQQQQGAEEGRQGRRKGGAAPPRPTWEAMEANFEHFRQLILAHSVGGGGADGEAAPLFTLQAVKAVTSFVTKRCVSAWCHHRGGG